MTRTRPGLGEVMNLEVPTVDRDRLIAVRDQANAGRPRGRGRATIPDALKTVLDWWDATADMRAFGIDANALNRITSEPR